VETYVVRVWLPDRPGALGQVASRIGALRGDVVGIDILERGGGRAVDELVVSLPDRSDIEMLVAEIVQVDGVAVEEVRAVAPDRPDTTTLSLEMAALIAEAEAPKRLELLCHSLVDLVDGEWAVALHTAAGRDAPGADHPLILLGEAPDVGWLTAFLAGSEHLDAPERLAAAPGDLVWARLATNEIALAVGRRGRPFHTRERHLVALLGRLTDSLLP